MPGVRRASTTGDDAVTGPFTDALRDHFKIDTGRFDGVIVGGSPADHVTRERAAGAAGDNGTAEHLEQAFVVEEDQVAGDVVAVDAIWARLAVCGRAAAGRRCDRGPLRDVRRRREVDDPGGDVAGSVAAERRTGRGETGDAEHTYSGFAYVLKGGEIAGHRNASFQRWR